MKNHVRPLSRCAIGTAALGMLLLSACGSDDNSSSATTPSVAETVASVADTAAPADTVASTPVDTAADETVPVTEAAADDLDSQVAALMQTTAELPIATESVDPGTHNIAVVTAGLASSGPATVATNIAEALKVIGWTAGDPGDGKFTPTEQAALIEKAVQDKVDAIILVAITPAAVSASVEAATTAGIPMVCVLCGPGLPDGMVGISYEPKAAGEAQAMYVAANSAADATNVVFQNTEFEASNQQAQAAAAKLKELCPGCTIETPSLLLGEAREPNAPIFTSLLNDHPEGKLGFVIMPFDTPAGALANTASQLGRTDFGIVGYGGLSPYFDMIGAGEPPVAKADILISTPYYAWAAVDQAARLLAGVDTWKADAMPVGLATAENVGDLEPGLPFLMPNSDYTAAFAALWGK
jgi:ABC-type sugar transport system substrate-binding protein